ncbi:hypothetical protein [Deinococcus alpinitundrae]|uniref:hypothetical protein n=1 Tax=Deinococcus alpinitundrae TaxID=468913 RepID=UPI00137A5530|nr:hypothetical protein [Deinococcus alpinitundrae]
MAKELGALGGMALKAYMGLNKFADWAGTVGQVSGAFGDLAGAMGETEQSYDSLTGAKLQTPWKDLSANLAGAGKAFNTLQTIAGDALAIITNPLDIKAWGKLFADVINSIADALAGFKKAQAAVLKNKADFAEQNPLLNPGDYQKTFTRSRGWFADTFGGGPEVVNDIDKLGLKVAQGLATGVFNGLDAGFKKYAETGNLDDFEKALTGSIVDAAKQGLIDGFKNDPARQATFSADIKAYTDAQKAGDSVGMASALDRLKADAKATTQQAKELLATLDAIDKANGTGRYSPEAMAAVQRDLASRQLSIEQASLDIRKNAQLISDEDAAREQLALTKRTNAAQMAEELSKEGLTQEQIALIRTLYRQKDIAAETENENTLRAIRQKNAMDRLNNEQTALELAKRAGMGDDVYQARKRDLALRQVDEEQAAALANQALTDEQRLILLQQFSLRRQGIEQDYLDWQTAANKRAAEIERGIRLQTLTNADGLADAQHAEVLAAASTDDQKRAIDDAYNADKLARTLKRIDLEQEAALSAEGLTAAQIASINENFDTQRQVAQINADAARLQSAQQVAQAAQQAVDALKSEQDGILNTWGGTFATAFTAGLDAANFDTFFNKFKADLTRATLEGTVAGLFKSMAEEELRPAVEKYRQALKTAGIQDDLAAIADIQAGIVTLGNDFHPVFDALQPFYAANNAALKANTDATKENTAAVQEQQFGTTLVNFTLPSTPGLGLVGMLPTR